ncbi:hypothetical protein Bbelb_399620 [Branchiostoma belcheri]|nr:hypothetical protein Bbelb_399620 [Branchiostoma belcheri]
MDLDFLWRLAVPTLEGVDVDWSNFFEFVCRRRYSVGIDNLKRVGRLTNITTAELRSLYREGTSGEEEPIVSRVDIIVKPLSHIQEFDSRNRTPNTEMAGKLMMVAMLCAVWCAIEGIEAPLSASTYLDYTHGVIRREYCLWEDQKMFMASRWTTLDCWKCECTTWKQSCEREDGQVPNGCMRIFDSHCNELIVRRDNIYSACDDIITGK